MDIDAGPEGSALIILAPRRTKIVMPNPYVEVAASGALPSRVLLQYKGASEASGLLHPYTAWVSQPPPEDYYFFRFTRPISVTAGELGLPSFLVDDKHVPSRALHFQERTHTWLNCNA